MRLLTQAIGATKERGRSSGPERRWLPPTTYSSRPGYFSATGSTVEPPKLSGTGCVGESPGSSRSSPPISSGPGQSGKSLRIRTSRSWTERASRSWIAWASEEWQPSMTTSASTERVPVTAKRSRFCADSVLSWLGLGPQRATGSHGTQRSATPSPARPDPLGSSLLCRSCQASRLSGASGLASPALGGGPRLIAQVAQRVDQVGEMRPRPRSGAGYGRNTRASAFRIRSRARDRQSCVSVWTWLRRSEG